MKKNKNVPKIRFKGFTEEWEERKLGEIALFNPKADLPEIFEYVDLESVVGTTMVSHREEKKGTAPSRAQRLAKQGDLFYQTVRPYQRNNYLFDKSSDNYVFSTGYAQMRPYDDGYFLLSLVQIEAFIKQVLNNCTGTSYPAISSTDLSEIKIFNSKPAEQTQIGNYFQNIDKLIEAKQSRIDKLKNIKKACLEKMFPKKGATTPEIRFKGFSGEWEDKKLGEIYDFKYGQFNNNPSNGGLYPVYGANGIIGGYSNYNAENSVVIGHMGEYAGSVLWGLGRHFVTYNGIITTPKNSNINSIYGYYMLFNLNIRKICGGSGLPFLSYDMLQKMIGYFPDLEEEQKRIAIFLTQLDNLISQNEQQLAKLKNIKKACLCKMFVNKEDAL